MTDSAERINRVPHINRCEAIWIHWDMESAMRFVTSEMRGTARRARVQLWAGLPIVLLLSGCFGNEPSASDIQTAILQSRTQRQDLIPNDLRNPKVEKLGCTTPPPGMAGLLCEFQVMTDRGGSQVRYIKTSRHFLKVNGAWQTD